MISAEEIREWAMAFEEALEQPHFEKNSFRIRKKIFCTLDAQKKQAVLKLSEEDQSVFCAYDHTAAYPATGSWGRQGWTIFEIEKTNADLFKDALTCSYCQVAPKKLAKLYLPPESED